MNINQLLIFSTMLSFLFIGIGCQTCLNEKEMRTLIESNPYTNHDIKGIDGIYRAYNFSPDGKKRLSKCVTIISNGKIRTQEHGLIQITKPQLILDYQGVDKVWDFYDQNNTRYFQMYVRKNEIDLVTLKFWLTLKKEEQKKDEQ